MYKKQIAFQKIVCYLAIFSSAAVFIYSLGIMTDLYDCLYSTMMNPNDLSKTTVPGSIVYYDMQPFNKAFLATSIILLLITCALFLTNTHVRRKYHIGNYVSIGVHAVASVAMCIWTHFEIEKYKAQFLQIDFEALKAHSELWKSAYTESTFWFDVHYAVFGVVLAVVALSLINLLWKRSMMKAEGKLIAQGKEIAA